jgi:hypothetical protein
MEPISPATSPAPPTSYAPESGRPVFVQRRFIVGISLVLALLAAIVVTVTLISGRSTEAPAATVTESPAALPTGIPELPRITVDSYTPDYQVTEEPPSASVYTFRSPSVDIVGRVARELGVTRETKETADYYASYGSVDSDLSVILYQKTNGRFLYTASSGVPLTDARGAAVNDALVVNYLTELGLADETVRVSATYRRSSEPGITFYELHRDWTTVGMPVLNPMGILNLPENQALATLAVTSPVDSLPDDADITGTSDKRDGLARPDDFNTITVGVNTSGNVVKIESNLRVIESTTQDVTLIDNETALARLRAGSHEQLIVLPSGEGVTDIAKVFPGNEGRISEATITDSVIAYAEQPGDTAQADMKPYWIFRGTGMLDSGYRVKFVATVPAIDRETAFLPDAWTHLLGTLVPQVHAEGTTLAQQQQGTFESPAPEPTATPVPPTSAEEPEPTENIRVPQGTAALTPTGSATQPAATTVPTGKAPGYSLPFTTCYPQADDLLARFTVGGYTFGYFDNPNGGYVEGGVQWYMVTKDLPAKTELENWLSVILATISGKISDARPAERIAEDLSGFIDAGDRSKGCPVRLTGFSPTLFVYGFRNTTVTIAPSFGLTYQEPALQDGAWKVRVGSDSLNVNGLKRPFVYYEYGGVSFDRPQEGWYVARNDIRKFVWKVASQLKLNHQEKMRLMFEIKHAANDIPDTSLFVGLIPRSEVDEKLPLGILPAPDSVMRYHFYVTSSKGISGVKPPKIIPIERTENMILELGGHADRSLPTPTSPYVPSSRGSAPQVIR